MSKPIILICGVPHSFTSMTANFLMNNGGYCDDTWDNPEFDLNYSRFESKELQLFLRDRKNFKDRDLSEFFDNLPKDKVVTLKAPMLIMFINEFEKFTDRPIKVVFVFRNPEDIILSSMNKGKKKSFIYFFERISWLYDFMVSSNLPVFTLVSERLLNKNEDDARRLLDFCELNRDAIDFSTIDSKKTKKRKVTYGKYRFANFFWKRLASFFKAV
ncbi:hypothetical protein [Salibacter halophilus]|jgi:hypothetical protein|uniref:Sulfotransferase domain-containing protein n=1 Tax=Salibacter halophilus TaxID=1803916 RepID=A0A6N6M412_9FLAO|nr:hypothetical protein [Salibacter halophilus]KAB1062667.1 hypothetical protein F3059_12025 [Salibacter halophilus]